jgi:acyl-coenzyme A synthetase/AMP-(fatty) acid ligase
MDVIGDDGDPLPARTLGELVFRSAGGAAWYRTGETAIRDEDGWFYAADRLRDECRAERRPERMSA